MNAGDPTLPGLELVVFKRGDMQTFALPAEGSVCIGRSEENQVRLEHASVSRRHARLTVGPPLVIQDLDSANGTFVREQVEQENLAQTHGMRRLKGASVEIAVGESVILGEVTMVVRRAARQPSEFSDLGAALDPAPGVVLCDPAMRQIYGQAERAAKAAISVLILGETGVGKDLLARAIHNRSPRAKASFVSINCAALSESLLEGELFGYERGAFTGAVQSRPGLLEAADGGSVFLDEIGELAPGTQAKLLRVLEERAVLRLGARRARPIDVRFLAATNRDLEADARAGRFRSDLYFRVAGLALMIPPLRERRLEIEPLARSLMRAAARQLDRHEPLELSREALGLLTSYGWPGNVRELKNAVERAVILCGESLITPEYLPPAVVRGSALAPTPAPPAAVAVAAPTAPPLEPGVLQDELKALERKRLIEALESCGGNQTQAAKLLGISRRTFVSRLGEYGMTKPRRQPE